MNLCDDGHEEVCFEGRNCPVCEKIEEIRVLEEEIRYLKSRLMTFQLQLEEG